MVVLDTDHASELGMTSVPGPRFETGWTDSKRMKFDTNPLLPVPFHSKERWGHGRRRTFATPSPT
jgi:hypothetical protein